MENNQPKSSVTESVNPYEAPKSDLHTEADFTSEAYFFTASPIKLILMSVCTFGFYELYWFYKNWGLIKQRTGENIMPVWRAVFAPLWGFSLFGAIKESAAEHDVASSISAGMLGLSYLLIGVISYAPDPFWLAALISFLPLLPVNALASEVNQKLDSDFKRNDDFSPWNWVAIVIGGGLLLLTIIGTFTLDMVEEVPVF